MSSPDHRVSGPAGGVPLVLGPSLGTSSRVWDGQIGALSRDFRVLRYDLPGHGGAPWSASSIADIAAHVLSLADRHGFDRFAYAGVSLGGAVGTYLAIHHPDRVTSLALICSSARFGPPSGWEERAGLVRREGTKPLLDATRQRWFAAPVGPLGSALLDDLAAVRPEGYAACCDALAAFDARPDLGRIDAPTLVVAGRSDPATPAAHARELADGIRASTLVELPGAAHLALVDRPAEVTAALLAHLDAATPSAAGTRVRRAVLGDAHVDRAIAGTTPFTADFQDLITRYAWGEIWTRPGLDRRTRSAITLTALVALGHHDELAMHVRGALNNGMTVDEIKEVLLQTAIYCGVPAANAAFAVARRVLDDLP